MLREVEHGLRVLAWMKTEDATRKAAFQQHYPERLPVTAAEKKAARDAAPPEYDAIPLDEMTDWLGWNDIPKGA